MAKVRALECTLLWLDMTSSLRLTLSSTSLVKDPILTVNMNTQTIVNKLNVKESENVQIGISESGSAASNSSEEQQPLSSAALLEGLDAIDQDYTLHLHGYKKTKHLKDV